MMFESNTTRKPFATIMVENGKLIVTNSKTFKQERVDPDEFIKDKMGKFHSSKDCTEALISLVGADTENYELSITPAASNEIRRLYNISIRLG